MPERTERGGALFIGYRPLCIVWTKLCCGDQFLFLSKRLMYTSNTSMDKSETTTNGSCQSSVSDEDTRRLDLGQIGFVTSGH